MALCIRSQLIFCEHDLSSSPSPQDLPSKRALTLYSRLGIPFPLNSGYLNGSPKLLLSFSDVVTRAEWRRWGVICYSEDVDAVPALSCSARSSPMLFCSGPHALVLVLLPSAFSRSTTTSPHSWPSPSQPVDGEESRVRRCASVPVNLTRLVTLPPYTITVAI